MNPFQHHHLVSLLFDYEHQHFPLDYFVSQYFRAHKALGSKDRGMISEMTYALIRWKGLLDYLLDATEISWEERLEEYLSLDLEAVKNDQQIPQHVRCSFPSALFEVIVKSHGLEQGFEICWDSNFPAPTTVRANLLRTTREKLIAMWKDQYDVSPCHFSPDGIIFHKKINFFNLPEFKQGCFEVQDEGSQLLANLLDIQPGQLIMDYCAGSGGKTLAFAPKTQLKGQIYLHDIRSHALMEAKKRLKRAGIQNAQVIQHNSNSLKNLKKKMDWILVDAPCSGTGTLRRNPDMKWKFQESSLNRLLGQQRQIFEKALSFLKPGGKIVYSTCSILKEENQDQMEHFLKTYPLELVQEPFSSVPEKGRMDGFFGCIFQIKAS